MASTRERYGSVIDYDDILQVLICAANRVCIICPYESCLHYSIVVPNVDWLVHRCSYQRCSGHRHECSCVCHANLVA